MIYILLISIIVFLLSVLFTIQKEHDKEKYLLNRHIESLSTDLKFKDMIIQTLQEEE